MRVTVKVILQGFCSGCDGKGSNIEAIVRV